MIAALSFKVMIQVSKPDEIKDPSARYTECVSRSFDQCQLTVERMMRSGSGGIFTRWFIRHPDGTESHHGEV